MKGEDRNADREVSQASDARKKARARIDNNSNSRKGRHTKINEGVNAQENRNVQPRFQEVINNVQPIDPYYRYTPWKPELPTEEYLYQSENPAERLVTKVRLLLVFDLNGTLFRRQGDAFIPRPFLRELMDYVTANHEVIIWTNSSRAIAMKMIRSDHFAMYENKIMDTITRDDLRLPKDVNKPGVKLYKDLRRIWNTKYYQQQVFKGPPWSQKNTVLIDDTKEKAFAQRNNLLSVSTFQPIHGGPQTDNELQSIQRDISELSQIEDVSTRLRDGHTLRMPSTRSSNDIEARNKSRRNRGPIPIWARSARIGRRKPKYSAEPYVPKIGELKQVDPSISTQLNKEKTSERDEGQVQITNHKDLKPKQLHRTTAEENYLERKI